MVILKNFLIIMSILITGSAGFIGFHLCKKLLENNNQTLINFVRFKVGEGIDKKESDFAAEVKDIVS